MVAKANGQRVATGRPQRTAQLFGGGERVAQLERKVEKNQEDMQAKVDYSFAKCKEDLFASHHQTKQAAVLLQQERAGNAEHFYRLDSAVQGLHEQASVAGASGTSSEPPLISLAQWQDNLAQLVALETETRELRATVHQFISCGFLVDPTQRTMILTTPLVVEAPPTPPLSQVAAAGSVAVITPDMLIKATPRRERAKLPKRTDFGWEVYPPHNAVLGAQARLDIDLGGSLEFPEGMMGSLVSHRTLNAVR